MKSSTPRPRSLRAPALPRALTALAVAVAAKSLVSSSSAVAPSPSGLLRRPLVAEPNRPRHPPCSRWPISAFTMPETGVHVADLGVHDAPIWVFTMPRSRCSRSRDFRNDLTDCFLLPSIEMQLRIAEKARPNVPNLETAIPLIAKQPTIRVVWGPYARPDPLDEQNIVTTVRLALGKPGEVPFITRRMAVQK